MIRRLVDAVQAFLRTRYFYPFVFAACAWPAVSLAWDTYQFDLGVNPVETLLHRTGRDAITLLFASLTVTPVRRLTGWNRLQLVRRTVGVWSFVYALTHLSVYVVFDQIGDYRAIVEDVFKRRFIFVGMLAFVILLALTLTSTNGMIRRLGRRWQTLHRLVYVAAAAATIHFVWGQKADISDPLKWASWLAVLFAARVYLSIQKRRSRLRAAVSR
ncbi:MAG: protein-methionine-sulfoxide reductase heme-binding subunit MsrQ [Acidobacteriota bacterium]